MSNEEGCHCWDTSYAWTNHATPLKIALRWTPPGKRKRGRRKTICRRTIEAELAIMDITWGQAQVLARDRPKWREIGVALCPTGDEEDYVSFLIALTVQQSVNRPNRYTPSSF